MPPFVRRRNGDFEMKKKAHLLKALFVAAALTVTAAGTPVLAAEPEENKQEEPALPETTELEIQSNKIPGWPEGPKVVARAAILMDLDTGEILYAKGIDEKHAPASTTKIMTAMVALSKDIPPDTKITFTEEVWNIEPESTHIGIQPGEILTFNDSLYAILLGSANEVSSGVAEYIGGSVQAFVDEMNQTAKDLGCENTHFVNANGLHDDNHYTTARDLAIIAQAAFQNETFRGIIKTPYYIIPETNLANETRWINNHHQMILPNDNDYYEGCLGGKNGYTKKANNTLVTYAEKNDMRLVCVVLDDIGSHYPDTKALLDYGFDNFKKVRLSMNALNENTLDPLTAYLKEEGLLLVPLQNTDVIIPAQPSEELTSEAAFRDDRLEFNSYYGKTPILTSYYAASEEIQKRCRNIMELTSLQSEPETIKSPPITQDSAPTEENDDSLAGFRKEAIAVFRNLPNWKYGVVVFFFLCLIFYIIVLVVKIKRAIKRHKKKKRRKQLQKQQLKKLKEQEKKLRKKE